MLRPQTNFFGCSHLAAHVNRRRRILTDANDYKTRDRSAVRLDRGDLDSHFGFDGVGDGLSAQYSQRHMDVLRFYCNSLRFAKIMLMRRLMVIILVLAVVSP